MAAITVVLAEYSPYSIAIEHALSETNGTVYTLVTTNGSESDVVVKAAYSVGDELNDTGQSHSRSALSINQRPSVRGLWPDRQYYYHVVWETGTETVRSTTAFQTTRTGYDVKDWPSQIYRKARQDINPKKILFVWNSDSGLTDEEEMVDDYIAAYGCNINHKIAVDFSVAATMAKTTIWSNWLSTVADYMETNAIEAVFLSPYCPLWLPYPGDIVSGNAFSGQYREGAPAQIVASAPLIKQCLSLLGSSTYTDVDPKILNSKILSLDADTPAQANNKAWAGHYRITDLLKTPLSRNPSTGDIEVDSYYLEIDGKNVSSYAPVFSGLYEPIGAAGVTEGSDEKQISVNSFSKELTTISSMLSNGQLKRVPSGRIGWPSINIDIASHLTHPDDDHNSPGCTRAALADRVSKSKLSRSSRQLNINKPILCCPTHRENVQIFACDVIVIHKLCDELGFTNLMMSLLDTSIEAFSEDAFNLSGARSEDGTYDTTTFTFDFKIGASTGVGSTLYVNPAIGGDYPYRLGGADLDFTSYAGKTFPIEVFVWFGGGLENADKRGTGHIFDAANSGFIPADGGYYQSSTSYGMHHGRWWLHHGGSVASGSLNLEPEAELFHHHAGSTDNGAQIATHIFNGHTVAYAEFFSMVNGVSVADSGDFGYAGSSEIWGDPLNQPYYKEALSTMINLYNAQADAELVTAAAAGDLANGYISDELAAQIDTQYSDTVTQTKNVIHAVSDMNGDVPDIHAVWDGTSGNGLGVALTGEIIVAGAVASWPFGDNLTITVNGTDFPLTTGTLYTAVPITGYSRFAIPAGLGLAIAAGDEVAIKFQGSGSTGSKAFIRDLAA